MKGGGGFEKGSCTDYCNYYYDFVFCIVFRGTDLYYSEHMDKNSLSNISCMFCRIDCICLRSKNK